jgi:hypothetical protein
MITPVLTLIPQPDGRVAVYEYGAFLGYLRDHAHAAEWAAWWEQHQREMAQLAWDLGDILWADMTPEQRRFYSQPAPADHERAA